MCIRTAPDAETERFLCSQTSHLLSDKLLPSPKLKSNPVGRNANLEKSHRLNLKNFKFL